MANWAHFIQNKGLCIIDTSTFCHKDLKIWQNIKANPIDYCFGSNCLPFCQKQFKTNLVFSWNVFPLLQHQKNEENTLIPSPQNDDVLVDNVKTIGQTINKEDKIFIHIGCHIYITNVLNQLETYNNLYAQCDEMLRRWHLYGTISFSLNNDVFGH